MESTTQGSKPRTQKNPRPRTDSLEAKAGMLEARDTKNSKAKDRLSRGQGHKRKCSPKKKRSSQKFFRRSPHKNVFQIIFQALHKILTIQKIVLSSSRGQANFRELDLRGQGRPRRLNLCKKCPLIKRDYRYRNIRIILGLPITDQWSSG